MSETVGLTVSELNLVILEALRKEPRLRSVTVRGEISGFRHHAASGHWYFSLKDPDASVSCVMFRQNTFHSAIRPRDGDSVLVSGYVDLYPKTASLQLYVLNMRPAGDGDLHARFEELKRRLNAEGLFDPARKRILPLVPRKVAVVTSGSGAAWHDILNVSGLRNPSVPIVLIPAGVQGERAAAEIAAGIRTANEQTDADVLVVARGGGSAEDLWCFNEEIVARAVAGSRIPVVSGVGHEIDTTICDLAADYRASTPSNAAEVVFPDRKELRGRTDGIRLALRRAAENRLNEAGYRVKNTYIRLAAVNPEKRILRLVSSCALQRTKLEHSMRKRLEEADGLIGMAEIRLKNGVNRRADAADAALIRMNERLKAMNPLRVLERGYTLVTDPEGRLLTAAEKAREAGEIRIRFADGNVAASVRNDGSIT